RPAPGWGRPSVRPGPCPSVQNARGALQNAINANLSAAGQPTRFFGEGANKHVPPSAPSGVTQPPRSRFERDVRRPPFVIAVPAWPTGHEPVLERISLNRCSNGAEAPWASCNLPEASCVLQER